MWNHYFASRLTRFYKTCYIKMLNVVRLPSCSFMEYNTYITWKHWEKNFGPTFQVRPKICIWPPDYLDIINPACTRHSPNAGLMLVQRRRRWASIEPTLGVCRVFSGNRTPTRVMFFSELGSNRIRGWILAECVRWFESITTNGKVGRCYRADKTNAVVSRDWPSDWAIVFMAWMLPSRYSSFTYAWHNYIY